MEPNIPKSALRFGFVSTPVGIHSGKTILVPEVSLLLECASANADYPEYRRLVKEENVVHKDTASNRKYVFSALARLYGLRDNLLLFHIFRFLWTNANEERPLLALLLAAARDSALRVSAPVILGKEQGELVSALEVQEALSEAFGDRYGPETVGSMARHLNSSWTQAGHLTGNSIKRRAWATSGPATVTYALILGYLCGVRGVLLYETLWSSLLDLPKDKVDAFAFAAAQRGWLNYRRIGDVAEINFPRLLVDVNDEEVTP